MTDAGPINILNNACQICLGNNRMPSYERTTQGTQNNPTHIVTVTVDGIQYSGQGRSAQQAKNNAARNALVNLLNDQRFANYLASIGFTG